MKKEYQENGLTESTNLVYIDDGRYEVTATGGYDGYLQREFGSVEEALDYIATLWKRA